MKSLAQQELESLTFGSREPDTEARLRELMLYIADQSCEDPRFGATKLNKLLYYADFWHFFVYGSPLTGAQYMKLDNGPAPRHLIPLRDQLLEDEEAAIKKSRVGKRVQDRLVALRDPDLDLFTASQIKFVDEVIERFWGKNATEMSRFSHDRIWEIAEDDRGEIPYEAVFISDEPVNSEDVELFEEIDRFVESQ